VGPVPSVAPPAASASGEAPPSGLGLPASTGDPYGDGLLPASTPVSRVGVAVMLGLLGIVLAAGIARNGVLQALGDLGFRSPAIAAYTLMLLSPIAFEGLYPRLRQARSPRARFVVENLHAHAPYLILIGTVMLVMRLQNVYDLDVTALLGLDWTPHLHRIEGDVVARLQQATRHPALDLGFQFVYVTVYALYHVVAMVGFAATGRTAMVKRFTVTWVLVYAIALPFYFLAPVNETWTTNPEYGCYGSYDGPYGDFSTPTAGVLHDECGDGDGIVFAISSINNCFPSLHNAFAWALPFLLWRSGWRRAAAGTSVIATLVSASTLYLGIHWITDLVAGIALAAFVTWVAVRFDYRLDTRLRLRGAKWGRLPPALPDRA
jgi:membrane-associated phospholipid phosphatase